MRAYRWVVEAVLFFTYFVFGISWLAWSPLMPEVERHFGVAHARAGLLVSLVSVAKAFVPLLAGLLAARLGLRRALLVGAGLAAVALVAPLMPGFDTLLAARLVFGVGGAIVVTLTGPMAMQWFSRDELPLVNGLNNVSVNTGVTVAMFAVPPLASRLGWQATLVMLGGLCALAAMLWAMLGREAVTVEAARASSDDGGSLRDVLRTRETWVLALAFTGPLSLYLALNTWLPTHLQGAFGLSRAGAAQLTGLFNMVGIPTALVGGWLTTRLGLRRPLIVLAGTLMPFAALGLCLSAAPAVRVASAVALGAAFFMYVAPLFTIPMELPGASPRRVALMLGVVYSASYLASFVSPLAVGWLQEATGSFAPGFVLFAVGSAALAVGGVLLPETGPAAVTARRLGRSALVAA
ncbi:MAG: MFS transporter [Proteobacteria bacterium]|nr:MFS transporter [Pseudomonadota bacterium]